MPLKAARVPAVRPPVVLRRLAGPACTGPARAATHWPHERRGRTIAILLVVLLLMLIGELPTWPHSRSWSLYPSSGLGIVVVVLVVMPLMERI